MAAKNRRIIKSKRNHVLSLDQRAKMKAKKKGITCARSGRHRYKFCSTTTLLHFAVHEQARFHAQHLTTVRISSPPPPNTWACRSHWARGKHCKADAVFLTRTAAYTLVPLAASVTRSSSSSTSAFMPVVFFESPFPLG